MILRTTILCLLIFLSAGTASAASHRTRNFLVTAQSADAAARIGERAEALRRELAVSWLGAELPTWRHPCSIRVYARSRHGGTGETSFVFENQRPTELRMVVLGPLEQLLESILPHEVTHLVLATHFGRRLPPWVDEGASSVVEATGEREKLRKALRKVLSAKRQLTLAQLFAVQEYPRDIVPLYTQGHALASYLIKRGGKKRFLQFVEEGLALANQTELDERSPTGVERGWAIAIQKHYGFRSLASLELSWLAWIGDASFLSENGQEFLLARSTTTQTRSPAGTMGDLFHKMAGRV